MLCACANLKNRDKLVAGFPKTELYALSSQITNAARSITANIAEGYGRYRYPDKRHFFIIARGFVSKTAEHLTTAFDEQYITKEQLQFTEKLCNDIELHINSYISYLDREQRKKR